MTVIIKMTSKLKITGTEVFFDKLSHVIRLRVYPQPLNLENVVLRIYVML